MDDSTLMKAETLVDGLHLLNQLRRKAEDIDVYTSLSLRKSTSDYGSPATGAPDTPVSRIRKILREENLRLADELTGFIREASRIASNVTTAKTTPSITVRTDEGTVVPFQACRGARLTFLDRVDTIEISPTEPETKVKNSMLEARIGVTDISTTQLLAERKKPTIVSPPGEVGITPVQNFSGSSSCSCSTSDQQNDRPLAGGASSVNVVETTPLEILDTKHCSAGKGPENRPPHSFGSKKNREVPMNIFKERVICHRPGHKPVRVKLPDVLGWEYEANQPWSSSDPSATPSRLPDALDRFPLRAGDRPIPCLHDPMDPWYRRPAGAVYDDCDGTEIKGGPAKPHTIALPPDNLCSSGGDLSGEHHGGEDALSDDMDEFGSVALLSENQSSFDGDPVDTDYDNGEPLNDGLAEYEPTRRVEADDSESSDLSERSEPSSPGIESCLAVTDPAIHPTDDDEKGQKTPAQPRLDQEIRPLSLGTPLGETSRRDSLESIETAFDGTMVRESPIPSRAPLEILLETWAREPRGPNLRVPVNSLFRRRVRQHAYISVRIVP